MNSICSRGLHHNTLVDGLYIHKGSQWVVLNATVVAQYRYEGDPCVCSITHLFNDFKFLTILEERNLSKSFFPKLSIMNLLVCRFCTIGVVLMSK